MGEMFKCQDCGAETSNRFDIHNVEGTKVILTVHRCDACQKRFNLELEFQREGETFREQSLICPWCGVEFEDYEAWGYDTEDEVECPLCGKHFDLVVREIRQYSTKRSLCDMPEDYGGIDCE